MNQLVYHLKKSIVSARANKRALLYVLISGACFGIFLTLRSIYFYSNYLLYTPLFIIGGVLLYFTIWIFYSALFSFNSKSEPESFLLRDSITYLPSISLLIYIISFFIKAKSIYPGITLPQTHLMNMLFLFFALLTLSLIISLKIFVHQHLEGICDKIASNVVIYSITSLFFIGFSILAYLKFNALNHYGGDIAAYIQRIWFITKTGFPKSTIFFVKPGEEPITFDISRWMPLYLSTPFMLLIHHPASILIAQAFFISISAIPIYLIGRDTLKSSFLGCLLSIAFFFYPATQYLYLQAFHNDAFGMAFLAFALYFLYKQKYLPFIISSALMVMCKENFFLIGIFLGLYAMLRGSKYESLHIEKRKIAYGSLCVVFSMLWAYLTFILFPPTGGSEFFMKRYGYLGNTTSDAMHIILTKPLFVLSHALTTAKMAYLGTLLIPFAVILPLLSGVFFIAVPIFAQNLLSARYPMYSIMYQYSAILIPVLYISAIEAISKIRDSKLNEKLNKMLEKVSGRNFDSDGKNLAISLVFLILFLTIACSAIYGPFGYIYKVNASEVSGHSVYFENMFTETLQDRIAKKIASQIPEDASVIVQEPFQILLSQRERIYMFPCHTFSKECVKNVTPNRVDYIILNLNNPRLENLDGWREWAEELDGEGWEKVEEQNGFIIFKSKA